MDNGTTSCVAMPSMSALCKRANRHRKAMRPAELRDLDYEFQDSFFPEGFWIDDVRVDDDGRHLIFATEKQLQTMKNAKVWYMDGTFRVVKLPFKQLYTVHTFIEPETVDMKQVPTVYILMSRQREVDYTKVIESILDRLGGTDLIQVQRCMLDFEKGVWASIKSLLPNVEIKGCAFHLKQAIFRRIQKLGLESEFNKRSDVYCYLKKLMALPFLHHTHIQQEFYNLKDPNDDPTLQTLLTYTENQWINSTVVPVQSWSVFGVTVRTNNDCEGWHKRINNRAGKRNLNLFLLIDLLHQEASFLPHLIQYVQLGQMRRRQSNKTKKFNDQIEEVWKEYEERVITPWQALLKCSKLISKFN